MTATARVLPYPEAPDAFEMATRIAAQLVDQWTAVERRYDDQRCHDWASMKRADGLEVSVATGRHGEAGRIVFRGCYPELERGNTYSPARDTGYFEITCSAAKDPKQLARDIERRVLAAGFEAAWREGRAYAIRWQKNKTAGRAAAERIAAVIGATVDQQSGQYGAAYTFRGGRQRLLSRLQLQPAGGSVEDAEAEPRIRFDLYGIDEETATKILHVLVEAERAGVT